MNYDILEKMWKRTRRREKDESVEEANGIGTSVYMSR